MVNINLTDEQARQITITYLVQTWDKNKDCMDASEHYKYYWILKEFASNKQLADVQILFEEYLKASVA